jgi:hypothetical protein
LHSLTVLQIFQIVSKSLSEPIRSHKDLDKDSAPLYDKAVKFYDQIAKQLVHQGHVLDLFACAVDQVSCWILFYEVNNTSLWTLVSLSKASIGNIHTSLFPHDVYI